MTNDENRRDIDHKEGKAGSHKGRRGPVRQTWDSMAERVRQSKATIKECQVFLNERSSWIFPGPWIEEFQENLEELAKNADELLVHLRKRESFIFQQLALEQKMRKLDQEQLEKIAEVLSSSTSYFTSVPELRNSQAAEVIRSVAEKLDQYDEKISAKLISYNERVRTLRDFKARRGTRNVPIEPEDLPNELDF